MNNAQNKLSDKIIDLARAYADGEMTNSDMQGCAMAIAMSTVDDDYTFPDEAAERTPLEYALSTAGKSLSTK